MKELTKAEEQIMQILWEIEKGFVNDILKKLPLPKPAYNTVSTIVRILERKNFVGHTAYGKTHEYFPLIPKAEYRKRKFKGLLTHYFDNSIESVVSFLVKEEKISPDEMKELTRLITKESHNVKEKDNE